MSRCDFCGKKARAGNLVSHSGIRTKRLFKPNIHRLWLMRGGRRVRVGLCTGCLSKVRKGQKELKTKSEAKVGQQKSLPEASLVA